MFIKLTLCNYTYIL